MAKEIVINAEKEQTRIAIVEKGDLAELYFENPDNARTLGDIYLGRIRRIMPSIKAAFVDIGQKQDAFLHFSDLAENLDALLEFTDQENPQVQVVHRLLKQQPAEFHRSVSKRRKPRHGKGAPQDHDASKPSDEKHHVADAQTRSKRRSAQRRATHRPGEQQQNAETRENRRPGKRGPQRGSPDLLKRNQRILVKIIKEPISNKGSRVSSNISLAGRFLVLVPLADYAAVSKKITSPKERRRLRALAKMLLPEGFGVIVRTVAQGKDAKSLDTDLRLLLEKWRKIEKNIAGHPEGPIKLHEDVSMASSIIRDLFSEDYDRILIDQQRMFRNIKNYIQAVAPQMASAVQLHKEKAHIFDTTGLKNDIEEVFESRVNLPTGGYLFIELTEAMHVIDVNSGRSGRGMNQEESSLKVNLEAARVLARQVRLRDLGGIIVVDFIDMREERNRKKVLDEMKDQFRADRAVTKILPMSDFGLMQITRQRLRPSITTTFSGPDGSANGVSNQEEADRLERARRSKDRTSRHAEKESAIRSTPVLSPEASPEQMIKRIEAWIVAYKARGQRQAVKLCVHPFTAAFLNRGIPNQTTRWGLKHRMRIRLEPDSRLDPMAYCFIEIKSGTDVTDLNGRDPELKSPSVQEPKTEQPSPSRHPSKPNQRSNAKPRPQAKQKPLGNQTEAKQRSQAKKPKKKPPRSQAKQRPQTNQPSQTKPRSQTKQRPQANQPSQTKPRSQTNQPSQTKPKPNKKEE